MKKLLFFVATLVVAVFTSCSTASLDEPVVGQQTEKATIAVSAISPEYAELSANVEDYNATYLADTNKTRGFFNWLWKQVKKAAVKWV